MFSDEDLSVIAPTSKKDVLGNDLIGDVDKKHIKVVIARVVRLELNLDLIV